MLLGYSPLAQTAMGTAFTWGATALGAAFCALQPTNRKSVGNSSFLDASLGFSAGVMLAASFWSLLQPAIELARTDVMLGGLGMDRFCYLPAAIGVIFGALFIIIADYIFPEQNLTQIPDNKHILIADNLPLYSQKFSGVGQHLRQRGNPLLNQPSANFSFEEVTSSLSLPCQPYVQVSNRLWLLLLAITVHNIPEGLAVGVAFGYVSPDATSTDSFIRARNLALGMAIQNFPEGLAVSLPLRAAGFSIWRSFWYGQLSGFVEPIAGIFGCIAVQYIHTLQPYALGFAAGAMLFVIFDDIIPEAHKNGNGRIASILACAGFVVMMALDVGFA